MLAICTGLKADRHTSMQKGAQAAWLATAIGRFATSVTHRAQQVVTSFLRCSFGVGAAGYNRRLGSIAGKWPAKKCTSG